MKQYTTPEQTAKLIELGLAKPKNTQYIQRAKARNLHSPFIEFGEPEFEGSYSIGELIELLPEVTCRSNNDDIHYYLTIYNDAMDWNIAYRDGDDELCYIFADELIDALYDMVIKLKGEGVI